MKIMPVTVRLPDGEEKVIDQDEGPREDTSMEKLAALSSFLYGKRKDSCRELQPNQ